MENPLLLTRRDALRMGLLFSASLLAPRIARAAEPSAKQGALDLFCLGDWGCGATPSQVAVAQAMQDFAGRQKITPHALMMLGDNFYGPVPGGVRSPRWKTEFEDMYPARVFPGKCHSILGNHDYDDQPGGDEMQIAYSCTPGTRWSMPARWYRLDLPHPTVLCVNTHHRKMSPSQIAEQQAWLEKQLAAPRTAPWLIVCGHHPVRSCGPHQNDSKHLLPWRELFQKASVDAYLCGHEHDLQHLRKPGYKTDYFVAGGGGMSLHDVEPNDRTVFAERVYGFLHLNIGPGEFNATFVGTGARMLYSIRRTP